MIYLSDLQKETLMLVDSMINANKTFKEITDYFTDIFPGDPARGDFALFGYGVENMI